MKIEKKDIEYIANLSRIELSNQEKETFIHQLSDILAYIDKLNQLNTQDIKPMAYSINTTNVLRDDKLEPPISREDALTNAPSTMGVFFKVPKVIE
ncbi:MAG: Asp-tRNA(Asn)/Glu-tRNA(Gln) amidotransferase subunit GatC [Planctomycetes bacterium]|nr:Asp-tRNA(Asn)/Glu-tRNA(Gln) amidotransferase subunit GatC [Planctomycetota bacterium]